MLAEFNTMASPTGAEARGILEAATVRLACERAGDDEVAALRAGPLAA